VVTPVPNPERYAWQSRGFGSHQAMCEWVRPGSKVLDLGCASGYLMDHLRETKACQVVGIEPDPEAVARARSHGHLVIDRPAESGGIAAAAAHGPFDHIVMADVLEHTADPEALLQRSISLLAPGGTAIVSLPNVVSLMARLRLMLGIWRYQDNGIFDRSHLRFFTLRTARELLLSSGLELRRQAFVGPLTFHLGRPARHLTRIRPQLLANQMIFEAAVRRRGGLPT
jgi:methionine biosynthesis protein MetW